MQKLMPVLICVLVLFYPLPSAAKEKLAVMDLTADYGVSAPLAIALSRHIRDQIHSHGTYEVMSKEDVYAIVDRIQCIQESGAVADIQCLVDAAQELGSRYMVIGSLAKLGSTYSIHLRLLDTGGKDPGVKKRANKDCRCAEDRLILTARDVANALMGDELAQPAAPVQTPTSPSGTLVMDRGDEKRFTRNANGVITDHHMSLEWFVGPDVDTTLDVAKQWVTNLKVDGDGWRMPSTEELKSLYQKGKGSRNIDPMFKTTGWYMWSGKPHRSWLDISGGWIFSYYDGVELHYRSSRSGSFRCFAVRSLQKETQTHLTPAKSKPGAGEEWKDPITDMEFVWVPGGCFQMGQSEAEKRYLDQILGVNAYSRPYYNHGLPQHEVCVDGFWIGKYEVTNAQYRKPRPRHDSGNHLGLSLNDDGQPVVNVSWKDAKEFAKWLSDRNNGNYVFRLPTEAEWEFACRAGTQTARFWRDNENEICRYENVYDASPDRASAIQFLRSEGLNNTVIFDCYDGYEVTAPVGSFQPNPYGLYDILGNVCEWCEDVYASNAYAKHERINPLYANDGAGRVIRGGSWIGGPLGVRCAARRGSDVSDYRWIYLGFRLVREP